MCQGFLNFSPNKKRFPVIFLSGFLRQSWQFWFPKAMRKGIKIMRMYSTFEQKLIQISIWGNINLFLERLKCHTYKLKKSEIKINNNYIEVLRFPKGDFPQTFILSQASLHFNFQSTLCFTFWLNWSCN